MEKLNINEVKKDLYRTKNMAKFVYYEYGKLNYIVEIMGNHYEFPISTIEGDSDNIKLSEDLGLTKFNGEIKGSELIRWLKIAIDNETIIKVF